MVQPLNVGLIKLVQPTLKYQLSVIIPVNFQNETQSRQNKMSYCMLVFLKVVAALLKIMQTHRWNEEGVYNRLNYHIYVDTLEREMNNDGVCIV